jgi:tRNA A-37 threonylcarbamoyl transferase component Bud32
MGTYKKYSPGKFSEITFFEIDEQNKTQIEKKINLNIENIIVKKKYLFKKKFQENNNYYIIEKFGGIKNLFQREIKCLQSLFKLKHFPLLLAADYDNLEIYMNYCGENLKENNIPHNWKEQIDSIITSLNEVDIFNNDFWINNMLVHKKILYMIDFGFSSFFEEDFPFVNIDKDELNIATDLIMLLDNAMDKKYRKKTFIFLIHYLLYSQNLK